ncbi:MAG: hypothetical protein HY606_11810 [Planctomycetes bacterium]|nr:hypothetical protein [Planctomycetota bacterium]
MIKSQTIFLALLVSIILGGSSERTNDDLKIKLEKGKTYKYEIEYDVGYDIKRPNETIRNAFKTKINVVAAFTVIETEGSEFLLEMGVESIAAKYWSDEGGSNPNQIVDSAKNDFKADPRWEEFMGKKFKFKVGSNGQVMSRMDLGDEKIKELIGIVLGGGSYFLYIPFTFAKEQRKKHKNSLAIVIPQMESKVNKRFAMKKPNPILLPTFDLEEKVYPTGQKALIAEIKESKKKVGNFADLGELEFNFEGKVDIDMRDGVLHRSRIKYDGATQLDVEGDKVGLELEVEIDIEFKEEGKAEKK